MQSQRAQRARHECRQDPLDGGGALESAHAFLDAPDIGVAQFLAETELGVPQPVFQELLHAWRGKIFLSELPLVAPCRAVEEIDAFVAPVDLETIGSIEGFEPPGDFLECLGRVLDRQLRHDLACLHRVGHRVVNLAAAGPFNSHAVPLSVSPKRSCCRER